MPASRGTVTVDGASQPLVAHLSATGSFDLAGLTWSALSGNPTLQLRARTAQGWSEWTDAGADGEGNGPGGSSAIYTGAATAIEVRVFGPSGTRVQNLRVSLIDSTVTRADQKLATTAAQAAARRNATRTTTQSYTYATMPTVITRAQWGADESLLTTNGASCVKPSYDQTVQAAIVHHTDGSNTYTQAAAASIVRGIYAFHVKDRGWCDVGYNFLVDKYGDIFEGRHGSMDLPLHGAHATLWNTNTVGISVMMNSMTAKISTAAETALARVIAWKLAGNYVDPNAKVYMVNGTYPTILRHGDVMSTSCPGRNITADMANIRALVTRLMGNWHTPINQAWATRGGASGTLGKPYQLEESYAGGRLTVFAKGAVLQLPSSTTTRTMDSAAWNRYTALGGASSLGFPSSDQLSGTVAGTSAVDLPGGRSIIEDTRGAWLTTTAIKKAYWNNATVRSRLGAAVGDAAITASGSTQLFEHGRIIVNGSSTRVAYSTWGDQSDDAVADLTQVATGGSSSFRVTTSAKAGATLTGPLLATTTTWVAQVSDLTNDGRGELLSQRSDGSMWLQLGTGRGGFGTARRIATGLQDQRKLTVEPDMNGDGLPELLSLTPDGHLVRRSISATTLGAASVLASGWGTVNQIVGIGDLNGDGNADVLEVNSGLRMYAFMGTGHGTLASQPVFISRGWSGFSRLWSPGDLTGDGRPDVLAMTVNDGALRVYATQGTGLHRGADYLTSTAGTGLLG